MKQIGLLLFILFTINCFGQKIGKFSVYFKFDQADLDNKSKSKIDSFILSNKVKHLYLQGHCDSVGSNAYNDVLSEKRVQEVKRYLLSKNVPENSIGIKALGKRAPLNKNETENARALNRRVEVEFESPLPKDPNAKEVEINGVVQDEAKQRVAAEISLNDSSGKEIFNTWSDKEGKYQFKISLNKNEDYTLVFYNETKFIDSKTINASNPKLPFQNLNSLLPELKSGENYVLKNMNFVGDTSELISASEPSLFALYKIMKKNSSLIIRIEGHVNFPNQYRKYLQNPASATKGHPAGMTQRVFNQWLSEQRANAVLNYLVKKGIDPKRMSTIGYGSEKMLFPDAITDEDMEQNRRVEINVISFR